MKKVTFIIALIVCVNCISQEKNTIEKYERLIDQIDWTDTSSNKTVEEYLDYLYSGIDFSYMKTKFFYGKAVPYSGIENFDGKNLDTSLTENRFKQLYSELLLSQVGANLLPSFEDLKKSVSAYIEKYKSLSEFVLYKLLPTNR